MERHPLFFIVIRKTLFAVGMALLLIILGLFNGIGYKVCSIDEVLFTIHSRMGYADAVFYVDITFNPILYPIYWLKGFGSIKGNYSMMYVPESYKPGEFGGPIWGISEKERYDTYITFLATSGITSNFVSLLFLTALIEIIGHRKAYFVILCGLVGFAVADLLGVIIGAILGLIILLYMSFKNPKLLAKIAEEINSFV